jgi:hypothetical protein
MDYPVWDLAMGGGLLMALVAGLATVAWMVRRVLTSPAAGADAA